MSRDHVRKVAELARLELTDSEIDTQVGHINQLLDQFDKLQELDVDGVEPTSHSFPISNVLRADEETASLPRDEILANAPETRDGCFVVPRILEI